MQKTSSILYSFRRCPFAIRARWALALTNQKVILREVILKDKPKELIEISKKGTVPVLITENGEIIDESIEIMKWAISQTNGLPLSNQRTKEEIKNIEELIINNDIHFKYHLDRYKYSSRYINISKEEHKTEAMKIIYDLNKKLSESSDFSRKWLVGNSESLADWAIWPFIRQFRNTNPQMFDMDNNLESVRIWLNYYLNHNKFKVVMNKYSQWVSNHKKEYFPA